MLPAAYRVTSHLLRIADGLPDPLTEAELSRIWAGQSFPAEALTLADGRRLRVLQPGRPGGGSGPDFRDAVVAIDGIEQAGDVELHVRASSFFSHGHHRDAAYDNVVLHVVYAADDGTATTLHSGRPAPIAQFAPWVGQRTEQIGQWLATPPLWQEPCSDAAGRIGTAGIREVLRQQGAHRFHVRMRRLEEAVAAYGTEQAFWTAVLDCLGYGPDRASWRRMAGVLPVDMLKTVAAGHGPEAVESALLAAAGHATPPETLASCLPRPLDPPLAGGSRPAARPERRLRALAALWRRAGGDLPAFARSSVAEAPTLAALTGRWSVTDPLGGPALLGADRARELLLNAVLPMAALDAGLKPRALAFAEKLPVAPAYGKTAFLEANLQRSDQHLRPRSAFEQQGLLAMISDWCRQGGCGRCPLS